MTEILIVVSVGTSEEDLSVGDVSVEAYIFLRNVDPAGGVVVWGPKNGGGTMEDCGRLESGEIALLRMEPGVVIRWQAQSSACLVWFLLLED